MGTGNGGKTSLNKLLEQRKTEENEVKILWDFKIQTDDKIGTQQARYNDG